MNMRLIFLAFLSVIIAFYLKVQADGFVLSAGKEAELEQSKSVLHYVFSILLGVLGLVLAYLAWKPPTNIKPSILAKSATALYLLLLLVFIAINYFLGISLNDGTGG